MPFIIWLVLSINILMDVPSEGESGIAMDQCRIGEGTEVITLSQRVQLSWLRNTFGYERRKQSLLCADRQAGRIASDHFSIRTAQNTFK